MNEQIEIALHNIRSALDSLAGEGTYVEDFDIILAALESQNKERTKEQLCPKCKRWYQINEKKIAWNHGREPG